MRSSRALSLVPALLFAVGFMGASPQNGAADDGPNLKNPIPVNAATLAEGKALFTKNCSSCHGPLGKGDGKGGAILKPPPADLTDATWKHGTTDGEIFMVIRDGAKGTGMRGFAGRMTTKELWTVVNYVRSLAHAEGPS